MSGHLIYILLNAFAFAAVAFALWKGGRPERLAAGIVVLNLAIGYLAGQFTSEADILIRLCNDGLAAIALLVITLLFGAPWLGGAMFFYAAQFALHSYYLVIDKPEADYLSAVINNINWNGVIWCLVIGTAMAWRQRARGPRAAVQA